MKINILIPVLGPSGGIRVIYEIANRLQRNHDVVLYYPVIPPEAHVRRSNHLFKLASASINALNRTRNSVEWMDLNVPVKKVVCFQNSCQALLERQVRDGDILIATSWPTAYTASELPPSKGEEYYFMQHYEIWPVWNDLDCWKEVESLNGSPSIAMADVTPDDPHLAQYKDLVDESYSLPVRIIRTSEWEEKILDQLGENSVGSVSYGVDHELFYPSTTTEQQTVLALYRNSPEKGDRQAIAAFEKLHRRNEDIEFLMFGRSKSSQVPRFVEFEEDPSQEMIRDLYSRSDIFVYPSWVEGYGMPPMEAMACRNALVSTDVGAVRDYTPQEGVEFVPVRDVNAIVSKVERLLQSPDRLESMKERNREYIQQFRWEKTAEEFESIITS